MTDEEKIRRILAKVSELNAQADTIQDPIERRRFLSEEMQRIHTQLEPILGRCLAETKRGEQHSISSDPEAIDRLLLLTTQALKAARLIFQALLDKPTKPRP